MRFDILTLFPEMFDGYFTHSILQRAQDAGHIEIGTHNIRDYAPGKHRITDEPPYGGGGGMVLKAGPIFSAAEDVTAAAGSSDSPVILLTPQGRPFTQQVASELAKIPHIILLCGRYVGIDERVRRHLVTDEISIGVYVLTGGVLAAMVVVDAVARLLTDVLGADGAAVCDSFSLLKALDAVLEDPPHVLNLSLRGPHDALLEQVIQKALDAGVVVVAAGLSTGDPDSAFPSSMRQVLGVGVALTDGAPSGSQGDALFAPGAEIIVAVPTDHYDFRSGSSLAAAHVSGVVALLLSVRPDSSLKTVSNILRQSQVADVRPIVSINACVALNLAGLPQRCGD